MLVCKRGWGEKAVEVNIRRAGIAWRSRRLYVLGTWPKVRDLAEGRY